MAMTVVVLKVLIEPLSLAIQQGDSEKLGKKLRVEAVLVRLT
jgi:hypothetical protein